jgi:Methyltransferase domain
MKTKNSKVTNGQQKIWKLDLGCGETKQQDFTGVDKYKVNGVDIVHDLTKYPWPFKDNSVSDVHCSHFVEHLTGQERILFFNELYRIMIPGGKAKIITPYYKSIRAYQDPTHAFPPVCENFYYYLDVNWRRQNRLDHYLGIKCDFEFFGYYSFQDGTISLKNEETRNFWIDKYWNIVADLIVELVKR